MKGSFPAPACHLPSKATGFSYNESRPLWADQTTPDVCNEMVFIHVQGKKTVPSEFVFFTSDKP